MTDEDVEKIIKANMNLQMNLAGIRQDFEEKTKREWVGLTEEDFVCVHQLCKTPIEAAEYTEHLLKEKNTW